MSSLLLVAVGSVLSIVASVVTTMVAGRNERRRDERAAEQSALRQAAAWVEERAARKEEREVAAAVATHEMRLDIVLQLQEALQRTARLVARAMLHDQKMAKAGKFTQLPDGLSEEMFDNSVLVAKLRERLLNESLRREVQHFHDRSVAISLNPQELYGGRTPEQLERRGLEVLSEWNDDVERVTRHVGEAVRAEMDWRP